MITSPLWHSRFESHFDESISQTKLDASFGNLNKRWINELIKKPSPIEKVFYHMKISAIAEPRSCTIR